ncbi:MAG: hypothetical protein Q8O59_04120 [bacterium]|nr:hypothetical protein [bacterium]
MRKKSSILLSYFVFLLFFLWPIISSAEATNLTVTIIANPPPETCGNSICTGNETCANCPADCGACSSGGGGSSSYVPPVVTQVIFKGLAYPQSDITLLKDAQIAATTRTGPDAKFEISLAGLSAGIYTFGVWAEDKNNLRSITHTFSTYIMTGATILVNGIFLPPTISLDKTEVKRGEPLNILGYGAPKAEVVVFINSEEEIVKKTVAQADGGWLYSFDTLEVDYGDHIARARSSLSGGITTFSKGLSFKVSSKSVSSEESKRSTKTDLNNDNRVNLIDFSIAAYWYKRPLTEQARINVDAKLKADGVIDLIDFSILAYYWTG